MTAHTPIPERRRLVARWQHTTPPLSMTAFARSAGVSTSTFSRWIREHADEATALAFVEVTPAEVTRTEVTTPGPQELSLRISGPAQAEVALHFDQAPDAVWLGQVLREVLSC